MTNYQLPAGKRFEIPEGFSLIGKNIFPKQSPEGAFKTDAQIDSSQYALVQDGDKVIAVSMAQQYDGKGNFWDLNRLAFDNKLKGFDARKFLSHLYKVNEALKGNGALYDANGSLVEGERLAQYAQRLNHNCWAYLNGHFKGSSDTEAFHGLDFLVITGYNQDKNPAFLRTPLKPCLEKSCWADVTPESLNEQGLPTKKSPIGDKYEPGKTAYFGIPFEGAVAWFYAGSYGADLLCDGDPGVRDGGLGVFASAEGASSEQNKGNK